MDEVDGRTFADAMARYPAGVTIVSTTDEQTGRPHGFTASSFCPVSLDPPLVLVCLAKSAESYPAFSTCTKFAVSIVGERDVDLAYRFATKRLDKFAVDRFRRTADGLLVIDRAVAVVECRLHDRHEAGDHVILVGWVLGARVGQGTPAVYLDRRFGTVDLRLPPLPEGRHGAFSH
jgi:flavin reductase ActVB